MTFQDRIHKAFTVEQARRRSVGKKALTKTELWTAVGATSAAATHWFSGANGMDLDTCIKAAPVLNVNPFWLFDGSGDMSECDLPGLQDSDGFFDIYAVRRKNLQSIVNDVSGGNIAEFARKVNRSRSQVSQYLSAGYNGGRSIGERIARQIEKDLDLPMMELDKLNRSIEKTQEPWPFKRISRDKIRDLSESDLLRFETLAIDAALRNGILIS